MKVNKQTALKGTCGTTAFGGLLAALIVPGVMLDKTKDENEQLKKQLEEAQKAAEVPIPVPVGTNPSDLEVELKMERDGTNQLEGMVDTLLNKNEALKQQISTSDESISQLADEITEQAKKIKELKDTLTAKEGGLGIKDETIKSLQKKVVTLEKQKDSNKKALELLDKIQKRNPLTAPKGCWLSTNTTNPDEATTIGMNCPMGFYYPNGKEASGMFTFWADKTKNPDTFKYFKELYQTYDSGTIQSGR